MDEYWRTDGFELWCWRRLLRIPWTARRSNQSILTKSTLNIHWKDSWWSWSFNTSTTWYEELTHWKRSWLRERLKAGEERDDTGWDGCMASLTQWTWVCTNSGRWWRTGKPGVLQLMGLQKVGHDSYWKTTMSKVMDLMLFPCLTCIFCSCLFYVFGWGLGEDHEATLPC